MAYLTNTTENFERFSSKISNFNWDEILITEDPNLPVDIFSSTLNDLYCSCFPVVTKYISHKRIMNPWLSACIMNRIKEKSRHFKLYKRGLISKDLYNRVNSSVNKLIIRAKNTYYLNRFNSFKSNQKKTWDTINSLMGSKKSQNLLGDLVSQGETLTTDVEKANAFNDFFCSIGNKLDAELPSSTLSPTFYCSSQSLNSFFFMAPVTEDECSFVISKLKFTKCNLNTIPTYIFIKIRDLICQPLSQIINSSFDLGIFPSSLKIARLTPVFKKGETSKPSNYRPIASLSNISKVFERCVSVRLMKFFTDSGTISGTQYGFQKGKSTLGALYQLTEQIYETFNSRKFQMVALLDSSKAFDTVQPNILLRKLELVGIRGLPLKWLGSYLSDRQYYVQVGDCKSCLNTINIGLPQGSILGPICYLIYVNEFSNISKCVSSILFADDTTVSFSHNDYDSVTSTMSNELKLVSEWVLANRITFNAEKLSWCTFQKGYCLVRGLM